jgi:enoyl-CoA hydratase
MWFHRLGLERAKRLLLTGDPMSGTTAAEWGFASGAYPAERLDDAARALCERIARLPANQLQFMKLLVNAAVEQQGLAATQTLGTLLDGAARHTPEGTAFSAAATSDLKAALRARDEPFGDYGFGTRTVADPLA